MGSRWLFLFSFLFSAFADGADFGCKVVRSFPHDPKAFTQGLVFHDGALYEGTGLNGRSSVRRVELATGKVKQIARLDAEHFGEGITVFKDKIYQLTYQSGVGFVYDLATFRRERSFEHRYLQEGWGLTHDGTHLIMSEGTATLRFVDPETLKPVRALIVKEGASPVDRLNELEWVEGEIFANVWRSDRIVRIDPVSGQVKGSIDCSHLRKRREVRRGEVLNGIAYDPASKRLFITGKIWPKVFEIR